MKQEGNSSFVGVVVKKLSLLSWIIATFTFEVFLHIVECIVTVQEMVEYITLHMGSANNCYPEVFLDVFLFSYFIF